MNNVSMTLGRVVAVTVIVGLSSCSIWMKPLADGWDGRSEPQCDDSYGPVVLDTLVAIAATGAMGVAVQRQSDAGVATAGVVGGMFVISGLIGESRRSRCSRAKATYDLGNAIRPDPPRSLDQPEAAELQQLRAEKAARDGAELERLRAEHNALTDAGVSVDAGSSDAAP